VLAEDPSVAVADGRCFFRYEDLVQLVELVRSFDERTTADRKVRYASS